MANWNEDLRTFITGSTAITDIVSTRVHYNKIPQIAGRPHVWFRTVSDTEDKGLDGLGGLHTAVVDIECIGVSEDDIQDLSDAVKSRLDAYSGSVGSHTAQAIFVADKDDDYIPKSIAEDEGAHVISLEATCWYTS